MASTSTAGGGPIEGSGSIRLTFFSRIADRIRKLNVLPDDVFVCSIHPGPGIQWVQEAVWCVVNDLELEMAEVQPPERRFPLLERSGIWDYRGEIHVPEYYRDSVGFVEKLEPPRLITTHLSPGLLPEKLMIEERAKVVYVAQNPRDMCVSSYLDCVRQGYTVDFDDFEPFCERVRQGKVYNLTYWDHVLQFWQIRNKANVLFITHEEMQQDLRTGMIKIANFLGKSFPDDELLTVTQHLQSEDVVYDFVSSGDSQPSHQGAAENIRYGRSPSWVNFISPSEVRRFEQWERDNLQNTDYPLVYS